MPRNPFVFPQPLVNRDGQIVASCDYGDYGGMELRDYFAGQALIGIMSDPGMRPASLGEFEHMATRMYQVADAMLAAREKGGA